jgi:hypothetical protein
MIAEVYCAACHHVAVLTAEALLSVGLSPAAKVLDLKGRLRSAGAEGKGERSFRSEGGRAREQTDGFCRNDTDITSAIAKRFETAAKLATPNVHSTSFKNIRTKHISSTGHVSSSLPIVQLVHAPHNPPL